jgi:hypothetical protein
MAVSNAGSGEIVGDPAKAPSDAGAGDGGVPKGQGLHPEQIRNVVLANQSAFQCCYETALRADPNAQGGVTIAFSIGKNGLVEKAIQIKVLQT